MQDCLWGYTKFENRRVRPWASGGSWEKRSKSPAISWQQAKVFCSPCDHLKPAVAPACPQVPVNVRANAATTQRRLQLEAAAAASPYLTVEKASLEEAGQHGTASRVQLWHLTNELLLTRPRAACLQEMIEAAARDPQAREAARPRQAKPRDVDGEE